MEDVEKADRFCILITAGATSPFSTSGLLATPPSNQLSTANPLLPIARTHPPHSPRVVRKPILDILKSIGSKTIMKHEILRQTLIPDAMLSIARDENHTARFDTVLDHLYIDDARASDDKVDFRVGVAMRGEVAAERPGLAFAAGRTGGDARRKGGGGCAVGGEEGFPGDAAVVAVVVAFGFEGVGDVLLGEDDGFWVVGFGCGGAADGGDEVAHVEGVRR